jgi:hypothetical protein
MSNFATPRRFSFAGLAFAAIMTLTLQGSLLMGFDQIATQGESGQARVTRFAKTAPGLRNVTLEPVVVTSRRA